MGVAYKLRKDIVDFIVEAKRETPSLSCRRFVGVIKSKYGVDVSKSSVNEVFKEFQLSGPVGRHSASKAPKNFSIPKEKKNILFKSVQPFLAPVSLPDAPAENPSVPSPAPVLSPVVAIGELSFDDVDRGAPESISDDRALSLRPDPVGQEELLVSAGEAISAKIANKVQVKSKVIAWHEDALTAYERLGASVMWFVFRAACANSHLGELLVRALGTLADGVTPQQCEALFFAAFFGEHRPGFETDDLRTLWRLAGLDEVKGRWLLDRLPGLDGKRELCAAVHAELAMAFTPIQYYRLLTRKGARFYIDASPMTLHGGFIDVGGPSSALPVFICVERVVDQVITNTLPLIAEVPSVGLTPGVLEFMRLMQGFGEDSLEAIELIGDNDTKCAEFQDIPLISRGFILHVVLTDSERSRVEYDLIENKRVFVNKITGASYGYFEGSLALEGIKDPLRVILACPVNAKEGHEIVLLSNISKISTTADDLLSRTLMAIPYVFGGIGVKKYMNNATGAPLACQISTLFRDVDIYARKFFLNAEGPVLSFDQMCDIIYNISGYIKEKPETFSVLLKPCEDFLYLPQLSVFLQRLNAAALKAVDGRQIVFSIF